LVVVVPGVVTVLVREQCREGGLRFDLGGAHRQQVSRVRREEAAARSGI